jgi:hypothetical protein
LLQLSLYPKVCPQLQVELFIFYGQVKTEECVDGLSVIRKSPDVRILVAAGLTLTCLLQLGCKSQHVASYSHATRSDIPLHIYSQARSWVEHHCPTNTIPRRDCIYVVFEGRPEFEGRIIRYRQGINIDQILKQASLPRPAFDIRVFRNSLDGGGTLWKPDSPYGREYYFQPGDLLWVRDRDYGNEVEVRT